MRQLAADLELALVEHDVHARPAVGGPVAHAVGAVALDQRRRIVGCVGRRLRELLAVGVDDEARDGGVGPRHRLVLVVRPDDRVEEPGADDVVRLGAHVHGERAGEQVGVVDPPGRDLRCERRRGPRVHDVGVGREPAGLVALVLVVAGGGVGGRVDGQAVLAGQDRREVVDDAVLVDGVPGRERHAEEPLAGDVPVALQAVDPVLVADPHELGPPRDLLAPGEHGVLVGVADEPLVRRDDLERPGAVLPELHRVGDGPGLALDQARPR